MTFPHPVNPGPHFALTSKPYRCFFALEHAPFRPCRIVALESVERSKGCCSPRQKINLALHAFTGGARPLGSRILAQIIEPSLNMSISKEPGVMPLQQFVRAKSPAQRTVHKQSRAVDCQLLIFKFHFNVLCSSGIGSSGRGILAPAAHETSRTPDGKILIRWKHHGNSLAAMPGSGFSLPARNRTHSSGSVLSFELFQYAAQCGDDLLAFDLTFFELQRQFEIPARRDVAEGSVAGFTFRITFLAGLLAI